MTGTNFGDLARKIRGGESATAQEMKNTPPEIIVTRRRNRSGGTELVAGRFVAKQAFAMLNSRLITISVNGQIVASLSDDETIKVAGVPGENVIGAGIDDRVITEVRVFLENGMKKRLFCGMTAGGVRLRET